MNIIFHFADLEVTDLSQLNKVEDVSPEAASAISRFQDGIATWQAKFITDYINEQPISYQEKLKTLETVRKKIREQ